MRKDTKNVHLPSHLVVRLKQKALDERTTIKSLVEKAIENMLIRGAK